MQGRKRRGATARVLHPLLQLLVEHEVEGGEGAEREDGGAIALRAAISSTSPPPPAHIVATLYRPPTPEVDSAWRRALDVELRRMRRRDRGRGYEGACL